MKFNKSIGIIKKLQNRLPKEGLLTIYKSFVRSQQRKFCQKLESYQYNAALAITGAIRGTSQTKIYKELRISS